MNKVQTANPVIRLDRAERQVLGATPARRLEPCSLRLPVPVQELLRINPDSNAA